MDANRIFTPVTQEIDNASLGTPPAKRPFRRALAELRRFARASRGQTIIEFALVIAPFLALLIAILETALVFFAQQALQTATTQAARLIMTGQAQNQSMTASQFQQAVCADLTSIFSCGSVYVNVQTFSSFGGITMAYPVQNNQIQTGQLQFNPGNPGDIVVVQVFYPWTVVPAPLNFNLGNLGANQHLLIGTAAFRNEPYK